MTTLMPPTACEYIQSSATMTSSNSATSMPPASSAVTAASASPMLVNRSTISSRMARLYVPVREFAGRIAGATQRQPSAVRRTSARLHFPRPDLFFVRSAILYVVPRGPGGNVLPFGTVTSGPVPPRGPTRWYCAETGARLPGFSFFGIGPASCTRRSDLGSLYLARAPRSHVRTCSRRDRGRRSDEWADIPLSPYGTAKPWPYLPPPSKDTNESALWGARRYWMGRNSPTGSPALTIFPRMFPRGTVPQ